MSVARKSAEVVLLTRYGTLGASSRLRCYQFLPALERAGFCVTRRPMFSNAYVAARYRNRALAFAFALSGYARRLLQMLRLRPDAALWIEYEMLPWLPFAVERAIYDADRPVIVEYDDAIFHRYDRHPNELVRRWLGDKIDRIMRAATVVVTGNDYLAEHARHAGARRVEVIPTVIDTSRYRQKLSFPADAFVVGWIGSGSTVQYLKALEPALRALADIPGFGVTNVGGPAWRPGGLPVCNVPWTEATEIEAMLAFDVGIMPLPDDPWTRGKCGYKLIQYMGCGLPVVASPVGVNNSIVEPGRNGFLATSHAEWSDALRKLAVNPQLRADMGARGHAKVAREYSLEAATPTWMRLFEDLLSPERAA